MEYADAVQVEDAELVQGLTREEDDELRRLHYLQQNGRLGPFKAERLIELRLRDRRARIRPPREFAEQEQEHTDDKLIPRLLRWRRR